jgi:hypothetical protein
MKKHLLLLALFSLLGFSKANCQTPDWVWARSGQCGSSTSGGAEGYSVSTDGSGYVYIGGFFYDTLILGPYVFNYARGVYIAKYDSLGNLKWAKCGPSGVSSQGIGTCIRTDVLGNTYFTGYYTGTQYFENDTLINAGIYNIFLVKYDSLGNLLWAKSAGGTKTDRSWSISFDGSENVYLTGDFSSSPCVFGSDTIISSGAGTTFLAKYDSSGNVLWVKNAIASVGAGAEGYAVATDAVGNIYVTGYFTGVSQSLIFGSDTLVNLGSGNIFLAKYDSSGNVQWAKRAGNTGYDRGVNIVTNVAGHVIITGTFSSSPITFGSCGSCILTSAGGSDAFLVEYDSSGHALWAKSIGGMGNDFGYSVATYNSNNLYIMGGSYISPTSVTFDTITLQYPTGSYDPSFIAGFDSSGNVQFAKVLASGSDDQIALAVSHSGSIYVCGDFYQINPFIVGKDTLYRVGYENPFVAKLMYPQIGESVPEISSSKEFILYPNPFEDKLTASPPAPLQRRGEKEGFELTLFDVFGRVLLRRSFINSATINTEQLARGMYFYEIKDKDGVGARGKLVKQ